MYSVLWIACSSSRYTILLYINDKDRLEIFLRNMYNTFTHQQSRLSVPMNIIGGNPFIDWNPYMPCFLSTMDLRRMHRRFSHPSTYKSIKLLQRSELSDFGPETRRIFEGIGRSCSLSNICPKTRQIKFTYCDKNEFKSFTLNVSQSTLSTKRQIFNQHIGSQT